ncbi:hypothetical protein [Dyadobacter sediminis]|uniref:DUF642 domain-containing protein n=2 Tax=Dyadobacter sediminis TaxID=1493691 RepID=A0A5R9KL11_9BACT|nr:hypothetical protein [Dyadobacter sediminis]TLU96884.1 hypothetical protein FEM55_07115 [Dyadobacter sediminis]
MVKITKSLSFMASAACLSTMLFMSSCSKEDAVTPSPEVTVNESSSLKTNLIGSGYGITPDGYLQPTDGPTCLGCKPSYWYIKVPSRDATSSLTAYAGNSFKKWVKPLPVPSTGSGSILTVVNDSKMSGEAFCDIKKLVIGQKYKVTFSVSTTNLSGPNGQPGPYAEKAYVRLQESINQHPDNINNQEKVFDFTNKKAQWITESFTFTANSDRYLLRFQGWSYGQAQLTYTNIHVGENAVQKIN